LCEDAYTKADSHHIHKKYQTVCMYILIQNDTFLQSIRHLSRFMASRCQGYEIIEMDNSTHPLFILR